MVDFNAALIEPEVLVGSLLSSPTDDFGAVLVIFDSEDEVCPPCE